MEIPRIKLAEVFVDGRCVGMISDVLLSQDDEGAYRLEGNWSGYPDTFQKDSMFTISIPSHECRFLTGEVDPVSIQDPQRIAFKSASFLPEGPTSWLEVFGDPPSEV